MSIYGKWVAAGMLATSLAAAGGEPPPTPGTALTGGTTALDLRLRAEHVDNESAVQTRDATATTLRARLGYTTAPWHGLALGLEYEGITVWERYDYHDGTAGSSETQRPTIADPAGSELNQAWIRYDGVPRLSLQLGRQRFVLDNQRFVGNVGWRQNEQTYDGAVLSARPAAGLQMAYAYFHNVNGVTFANFPVHAHLVHAAYAPAPWLQLAAYDYRLDFAAIAANRQDSETLGLRVAGTIELIPSLKPLYAIEYARQSRHADAAGTVEADYRLIETGAMAGPATLKIGYEVLGSNDGLYALQTPLATLHAFNGWADLFLTTPAAGLRDAYASAAAKLGAISVAAAYHRFESDVGGTDYGSELDASVAYGVTPRLGVLVKYAAYQARGFATDTEKAWLQADYRF